MVKKGVLEKLSDRELEKFIQQDTRKTPEAIQLAYEVLIKRGQEFSEQEHQRINELILTRNQLEQEADFAERKKFDKQLTEDDNAISLYTNLSIFLISAIFGILFGFILAMINYFILKKVGKGLLLLLIGYLTLFVSATLIAEYIPDALSYNSFLRWVVSLVVAALGIAIIQGFNNMFFPKDIQYKSRSLVIPVILIIVYFIISFTFTLDFLTDKF